MENLRFNSWASESCSFTERRLASEGSIGLLSQARNLMFDQGHSGAGIQGDQTATDQLLAMRLTTLSDVDEDFWTFRHNSAREGSHGISQYPAMMVPLMQKVLFETIVNTAPKIHSVYDPFVGSGTTLVEAMRCGLDFTGQDINPLAILLSKVKTGPFHINKLEEAIENVTAGINSERKIGCDIFFPGMRKWFDDNVVSDLSKIRSCIRGLDNKWCRQVLWVALGETIRFSSNSRTSTFKLHIRSSKDRSNRLIDTISIFSKFMSDIFKHFQKEIEILRHHSLLSRSGSYLGKHSIILGDSSKFSLGQGQKKFDLMITSPPYGDNTTTVPYGQYSYLALKWIDLGDIDDSLLGKTITSAYETDRKSLGGGRKNALNQVNRIRQESSSFSRSIALLRYFPIDRASRVAAFCRDLDTAIDSCIEAVRKDAYMVWITGNRRVGGIPVPLDNILIELFASRGVTLIKDVKRKIHNKRMAVRNSVAATMREESILVFRKG